jgi:hypothetical protein
MSGKLTSPIVKNKNAIFIILYVRNEIVMKIEIIVLICQINELSRQIF